MRKVDVDRGGRKRQNKRDFDPTLSSKVAVRMEWQGEQTKQTLEETTRPQEESNVANDASSSVYDVDKKKTGVKRRENVFPGISL